MNKPTILEEQERAKTQPMPVSEEDVEKDDITVVRPPPRRSGTIKVKLRYAGRSKPIPADDPSANE